MNAAEIDSALIDRIELMIPEPVRQLPGWLLWRIEDDRKIPYYAADGARRAGEQNSPADRAKLLTYREAVEGARTLHGSGERFHGFGFAPRSDFSVLALDLDNKQADPARDRLHDELLSLAPACYVERSPSGKGRHALLRGDGLVDFKSHGVGVELFAHHGYVTCTGDASCAGAGLEPIPEALRQRLLSLSGKEKATGGAHTAHHSYSELERRALANLAAWVPEAFAGAKPYHAGFRVSSRALRRNLEEDLQLWPTGIFDFGTEKAYSPLQALTELAHMTREQAAAFLKHKLGVPDEYSWLAERFKFIAAVDDYFDLHARQFVSRNALDALVFDRMPQTERGRRRPSQHLEKYAGNAHKYDGVTYYPGRPEESLEGAARLLNLYQAPNTTPRAGDATPFTEHLCYLLDDNPAAFGHVQSWLAFLVQRPGEKIAHGLLHINRHEGTGRGWLFSLLARVLGESNVQTLDEDRLSSRFNDHLLRCQLLTIPELETGDNRRAMALRLKPVLADARLRIERKGSPAFEVANRVNVIATSNRIDATFVSRFDRRWWIWISNAAPRGADYYGRLYTWLSDPEAPAIVLDHLLHVDLREFNPGARPEYTAARDEVVRASTPAVEQYVLAALEEEDGPFRRPLAVLRDVLDWLSERGQRGLAEERLALLLREHGAVSLGKKRLKGGRRPRVWACRDQAHWTNAAESVIAEYFGKWAQEDEEQAGGGRRY
jgi:hypothetical protein